MRGAVEMLSYLSAGGEALLNSAYGIIFLLSKKPPLYVQVASPPKNRNITPSSSHRDISEDSRLVFLYLFTLTPATRYYNLC